ncbi:homoserine O-acetyltransferase MetX [Nocardioides sp. Kera G14]|uniref:homoserine O-acetyltransferase MetX n=1 Tax=Nocardioides sp. Kera G14 TaxID=2884264 RepID=UPI001D1012F4|nr:homoserine O-acetyltransferase [Nocardioides sp. Kera G14]UDY23651.1 homoserine O-acetyltransferase [Nocardioides sp. Kera G14]
MAATSVALFSSDAPLRLSHGTDLAPVEVSYATYGTLTEARDNAVFIAHALTGDAHAEEWWPTMVGPGRPVDTDRFFVICPNLLGGCRGTTGPSSTNPSTGLPWGLDFPLISMRDVVMVHRALLEHLGVERLHGAVGGSLGGMQLLQWASDAPGQIGRAVLVAASARLSAQNIALSHVARQAILRDPVNGLAVARMLAHITYVSEQGLEEKFGRSRRPGSSPGLGVEFEVESYLDHQGSTFIDRFDRLSYLYLTRLLDHFDPFADPGFAARILAAASPTRFQLISFDSDWRFPTAHSELIEKQLRSAGVDVERHEVHSTWGHDSFLLDPPGYLDLVRTFLGEPVV